MWHFHHMTFVTRFCHTIFENRVMFLSHDSMHDWERSRVFSFKERTLAHQLPLWALKAEMEQSWDCVLLEAPRFYPGLAPWSQNPSQGANEWSQLTAPLAPFWLFVGHCFGSFWGTVLPWNSHGSILCLSCLHWLHWLHWLALLVGSLGGVLACMQNLGTSCCSTIPSEDWPPPPGGDQMSTTRMWESLKFIGNFCFHKRKCVLLLSSCTMNSMDSCKEPQRMDSSKFHWTAVQGIRLIHVPPCEGQCQHFSLGCKRRCN